jgi:hypothetical protein
MSTEAQAPAWERFQTMSIEVHEMLIGAAQCRNHLRATLECWDECDDAEQRENVAEALKRLTRVGI